MIKGYIITGEQLTEEEVNGLYTNLCINHSVETYMLKQRLKECYKIVMIKTSDGEIIAQGAIKNPSPTHRSGIFRKAKYRFGPSITPDESYRLENTVQTFSQELGYLYVKESIRHRGTSKKLVEKLLEGEQSTRLYATTSSPYMENILVQNGFHNRGVSWESRRNPNRRVKLFVKF